jgi:hydrogenase expression/formation protein HypE
MRRIELAHGGGGEKGNRLVSELFVRGFQNEILSELEDASAIHPLAFTTDAFIVKPIFFPGGDIGKLSVAGSCNDLAVSGAKPEYLSCSFMIEEGFPYEDLERIVESMSRELRLNGAMIVTGDTKVVPRGQMDGLFISTSGIGRLRRSGLGARNLREGDAIIVSGPVGDHGAVILMKQSGTEFESSLKSDCRSLWPEIEELLNSGVPVRAMRDVTRGGLAGILNEWAASCGRSIQILEASVPVRDSVLAFCDILGMEPYHLACEGTYILAVPHTETKRALTILGDLPRNGEASVIGVVGAEHQGPFRVTLRTAGGAERILDPPPGEFFPRIC